MLSAKKEFSGDWWSNGQSRPIPKVVLSLPVSDTLLDGHQSLFLQLLKFAESGGLPGGDTLSGAAHVCELCGGLQG